MRGLLSAAMEPSPVVVCPVAPSCRKQSLRARIARAQSGMASRPGLTRLAPGWCSGGLALAALASGSALGGVGEHDVVARLCGAVQIRQGCTGAPCCHQPARGFRVVGGRRLPKFALLAPEID